VIPEAWSISCRVAETNRVHGAGRKLNTLPPMLYCLKTSLRVASMERVQIVGLWLWNPIWLRALKVGERQLRRGAVATL